MFTSVRGYYDDGKVILKEAPPVDKRTEVIVTFLDQEFTQSSQQARVPGGLKGKLSIPDNFNEPLDDLNDFQ
jgi:hypothetical protein